ncbi:MAG: hypothetical protein ACKOXP_06135, partial [Flavobacteriales bacterium]
MDFDRPIDNRCISHIETHHHYELFLIGEEDLTGKDGEFQYVKCKDCQLVYQNPRIAVDQIKE